MRFDSSLFRLSLLALLTIAVSDRFGHVREEAEIPEHWLNTDDPISDRDTVSWNTYTLWGLRTPCQSGEWLYNRSSLMSCRQCTKCRAGMGVRKPCGTHHDTECEECAVGKSYSMKINGKRYCVPCTQCEHRHIVRHCSLNENAICGHCNSGYFYDDFLNKCRPCSPCYNGGIEISQCADQPDGHRCLPTALNIAAVSDGDSDSGTQPEEGAQLIQTTSTEAGLWSNWLIAAVVTLCLITTTFSLATLLLVLRLRTEIRGNRSPIYRKNNNKASYLSLTDSGIQDNVQDL